MSRKTRNVWNGRWWVHVRYCSTHCEALHELERYNARQTWLARIHTWQQSAELTEGDLAIACFAFQYLPMGNAGPPDNHDAPGRQVGRGWRR